jgi:hypothetical protein
MKANFDSRFDPETFQSIAPNIAAEQTIVEVWGVLNLAQCAQQNGEAENCWGIDYLTESFAGRIGGYSTDNFHDEIKAIWEEGLKSGSAQ